MKWAFPVAVLLLAGAAFCAMVGLDASDLADGAEAETERLRVGLAALSLERAELEALPESLPVKFQKDALSDFFSRTLEAGEVLGAGVRIESRDAQQNAQPQFYELRHGLLVAPVAVQAAADLSAAPALLSLMDEELKDLPVVVRSARARVQTDTMTVRLEVDVFGR